MFLKYLGKTPGFKYMGYDFSEGPAEVKEKDGELLLSENPRSFKQVVPENKQQTSKVNATLGAGKAPAKEPAKAPAKAPAKPAK